MKTKTFPILILFLALFLSSFLVAQVPQGIPYQAMIRNSSGAALANANVTVRFTLHQNTTTGAIEYQETQSLTTNAYGLINTTFGQGSAVQGTFAGINWSNTSKFIQVEANDGTGYVDMGTQQMMSVPYAMFSGSSNIANTATSSTIAGNGFSSVSATGDTLYLANGNFIVIPGISVANSNSNINTGNGVFSLGNGVVDADGNVYQTIVINGQEWMSRNLEVTKYRNGNPINPGISNANWVGTASGAYTYYNGDAANKALYGNLYNGYAVIDARGLCPTGWHVPSIQEWLNLVTFLDPTINGFYNPFLNINANVAGIKMKSNSGWGGVNDSLTNMSGFDALPAGCRFDDGSYYANGILEYWWSSTFTPSYPPEISAVELHVNSPCAIGSSGSLGTGFSVRCVKD